MSRAQPPTPSSRWFRRPTYWATALALGALALMVFPTALAAPGDSAGQALPVGPDGRFHGRTAPQTSTWHHFRYQGGDQTATISAQHVPVDATSTDLILYTGSPEALTRVGGNAERTHNVLTQTFTHPNAQDLFIEFRNLHAARTVSFVGQVSPEATVATPPAGTVTPTPGPRDGSADTALTVGPDGTATGTLGPRQAVWYRFWYGNPGVQADVSVTLAPSADGAELGLFFGSPANPQPQEGAAARTQNTLTRWLALPTAQFVFFAVVNNTDEVIQAYSARVTPAFATPTPVLTPTPVATPTPTATPSPVPTPTPQPAPPLIHDQRYFSATGFRIDHDAIWSYFNARGRVDIFGFPVSRTFNLLGCQVQVFQRQIAQVCPGRGPAFMNVLDPDLFPFTRVNFSTFPGVDEAMKNATPRVGEPDYDRRILEFVRAQAPDQFQGAQVNFEQTFFTLITPAMAGTTNPGLLGMINLEAWGAPISHPARDPNNPNFVYQRFQRGIMHHDAAQGVTRGILLADYLKQIVLGPTLAGPNLPPDLREQAQGTRFFAQYCPGQPNWLCRPGELPGTDLSFAFERG